MVLEVEIIDGDRGRRPAYESSILINLVNFGCVKRIYLLALSEQRNSFYFFNKHSENLKRKSGNCVNLIISRTSSISLHTQAFLVLLTSFSRS